MFTMAGVTKQNGAFKVRFLNDGTQVARVKILIKEGHTEINYLRLPKPMDKPEILKYLLTQPELMANPEIAAVIEEADVKYNGVKTVKKTRVTKAPKVAKVEKTPEATMASLKEKAAAKEPKVTTA